MKIKNTFNSLFVITMLFLLSGLSEQQNEVNPNLYKLDKTYSYLTFTSSGVPGTIADGWYQEKEGGFKNKAVIRAKQYTEDSDIRLFQRLEIPKRTNFDGAGIEIVIRLWSSESLAKNSFKSFRESNRERSAVASGYGYGTFSDVSLGELAHKYPIESKLKSKWSPCNASLEVLDGNVSLYVYYESYPKKGNGGWMKYPPPSTMMTFKLLNTSHALHSQKRIMRFTISIA